VAGGHAEVEHVAERADGHGLAVDLLQVRVGRRQGDRCYPGRHAHAGQRPDLPQGGAGEAVP